MWISRAIVCHGFTHTHTSRAVAVHWRLCRGKVQGTFYEFERCEGLLCARNNTHQFHFMFFEYTTLRSVIVIVIIFTLSLSRSLFLSICFFIPLFINFFSLVCLVSFLFSRAYNISWMWHGISAIESFFSVFEIPNFVSTLFNCSVSASSLFVWNIYINIYAWKK